MYFAAGGGTLLATLSYLVSRNAENKRRHASQVTNALSVTPHTLLTQFHASNNSSTFHRYVALEGSITTKDPVQYKEQVAQQVAQQQEPAVDSLYYAQSLRDKLYSCKFVAAKKGRMSHGGNGNQSSGGSDGEDGGSTTAAAGPPVGRVECGERWSPVTRHVEMSTGDLFMKNIPGSAQVIVETTTSSKKKKKKKESNFFFNGEDNNDDSSSSKKQKKKKSGTTSIDATVVPIRGVTITDMEKSSREMKKIFVDSAESVTLVSQKNQVRFFFSSFTIIYKLLHIFCFICC